MVNGPEFDSIQAPAADGKMRFWRDTSIAFLTPGDVAVSPREHLDLSGMWTPTTVRDLPA